MIDTEINILKKQILEQLDFFLIVYKRDSGLDSTNFIYMCADILNDLEAYQDFLSCLCGSELMTLMARRF